MSMFARAVTPIPNPFQVSITVSDLDASVSFYTELLGLPISDRRHLTASEVQTTMGIDDGPPVDLVFISMPESDAVLKLMRFEDARIQPEPRNSPPMATCFAYRTTNIAAVHQRLVEGGYPPRNPAVATSPTGMRVFFVTDPDGYLVELYEFPAEK